MTNKLTREEIAEIHGEHILFMDGHDDAFIGIVSQASRALACYDAVKVVEKLQRDGMTEEEAQEFFEFNINCAYAGEYTPMLLERYELEVSAE